MTKDLIIACLKGDYAYSGEHDDGDVKAYHVETDDTMLVYWNSSNSQEIRHKEALRKIADILADDPDTCGDCVYDGWNEIMFETSEK